LPLTVDNGLRLHSSRGLRQLFLFGRLQSHSCPRILPTNSRRSVPNHRPCPGRLEYLERVDSITLLLRSHPNSRLSAVDAEIAQATSRGLPPSLHTPPQRSDQAQIGSAVPDLRQSDPRQRVGREPA